MSQQNGSYGEWLLKYRFLVLGLVTAMTILGAVGAQFLYFDNDYRVFFGKDNPQLKAFEKVQQTYTKIDNVNFGDSVLIWGESSVGRLPIETVASNAFTIPYVLLCQITSRVKYQYVD